MKLKKILLLAAMALAAMVVAGPASASAGMMLHGGEPIAAGGETETFTAEGLVAFENESGGVSCNAATATIKVTTEDLHVTAFNPTECETTGLLAAFGCEVEGNPVSEELPWTVTIDPAVLTIHVGLIRNHMNPGCFFGEEVNITGGTVTATPNNPASISSITLSGEVETSVGPAEASGTLNASNPGTYEIE